MGSERSIFEIAFANPVVLDLIIMEGFEWLHKVGFTKHL